MLGDQPDGSARHLEVRASYERPCQGGGFHSRWNRGGPIPPLLAATQDTEVLLTCPLGRMPRVIPYLPWLTVVPVVLRLLVLGLRYRHLMRQRLSEAERDIDSHRTLYSTLAGFSFAGALGISVIDTKGYTPDQLTILDTSTFLLAMSFIQFFFVVQFQGHKFTRFDDEVLSAGCSDGGTLALLGALIVALRLRSPSYTTALAVATILLCLLDMTRRIYLASRYLAQLSLPRSQPPQHAAIPKDGKQCSENPTPPTAPPSRKPPRKGNRR